MNNIHCINKPEHKILTLYLILQKEISLKFNIILAQNVHCTNTSLFKNYRKLIYSY